MKAMSLLPIRLPFRLRQSAQESWLIVPSGTDAFPKRPIEFPKTTSTPSSLRLFSTTSAAQAKAKIGSRAHKGRRPARDVFRDPYTVRLLQAKRAALEAALQATAARHEEARGDPIHGSSDPTPLIKSLHLAISDDKVHIPNTEDGLAPVEPPAPVNTSLIIQTDILASENTGVARPDRLNDSLSPEDLAEFTAASRDLTRPLPRANRATADPQAEAEAAAQHAVDHAVRTAALARITAVENTSSRQRTYINTQRMVEEFGRHNTDQTLRPRVDRVGNVVRKERIGPDTGSSEVQIGILTTKIQILAAEFEGRSLNDKVNKRNLRLLLHRRQKLLQYLFKEDKGGDRWQNLIEKLGLTPATWEGEIEVRKPRGYVDGKH